MWNCSFGCFEVSLAVNMWFLLWPINSEILYRAAQSLTVDWISTCPGDCKNIVLDITSYNRNSLCMYVCNSMFLTSSLLRTQGSVVVWMSGSQNNKTKYWRPRNRMGTFWTGMNRGVFQTSNNTYVKYNNTWISLLVLQSMLMFVTRPKCVCSSSDWLIVSRIWLVHHDHSHFIMFVVMVLWSLFFAQSN